MGHPTIYPTGVTIFKPEKCWGGYTIFQAQEVGAVLMDMNGHEINVWKGVHGMPNKIFPGGYLVTSRGRRSGKFSVQDGLDVVQVDWDGNARARHATLEGQAEGAIQHLASVLNEAGASLEDVLQLRVYVRGELADAMAQVAPALARHFGAVRPALTGIGVASLASRDTLIEVEALAKLRRHPG